MAGSMAATLMAAQRDGGATWWQRTVVAAQRDGGATRHNGT